MTFRVGRATVTPIVEMVDSSFDVLRFFPLATEAEIAAHERWMAPTISIRQAGASCSRCIPGSWRPRASGS